MLSKSGLVLSLFALSKLAAAAPPACLLAALNTQSEPGDLESICGKSASEVQDAITELCDDDDSAELALEAYEETCSGAGYDSSSKSSMSMTKSMSSMMSSETDMSSTIALTSTYYDEDCSCTTTSVISTVVAMSSYGASGTGAVNTGTAGGIYSSPTESPGSSATGGLDGDDDDDSDGGTSTDDAAGAISTGAASRNDVGSFIAAVGAIAFAAVAL